MRTLCLMFGVLSVGALSASVGCGEPFVAGSGGGGAPSSLTGSGMGGEGGEPAAGGGGQGGCTACTAGEYCTARKTCERCSEFSDVLAFGTPPSPLQVQGTAPSFPRVRSEDGGPGMDERLVYVARFGGDKTDIGSGLGRPWTNAARLNNAQINTGGDDSGPFLLPQHLPSPVSGFAAGSLLFDSVVSDTDGHRKLFIAESLQATARSLLDGLNGASESYSVAVAHASQPYRYWFMNTRVRAGVALSALVTKLAADPEAVPLSITLPGNCTAKGDDLAPWVTPNGAYLFFQAPYSARGKCEEATVLRSFFVKLDPSGLPSEGEIATLLLPTFVPSTPVMTPSLSPDMCTLFFASVTDGQQAIFSAARR